LHNPDSTPTSFHQNDNIRIILASNLFDHDAADILTKLKVPVPGRLRKHWLADFDVARARKRLV
jgi:hypothetical protein